MMVGLSCLILKDCIMLVKIHELAAKEFDDAIEWYELQSNSIGDRFKNAVIAQIERIKSHPTWYLIEDDEIYKA